MDQTVSFDLVRLAGLLALSSKSGTREAGGPIEAVFNTLACNVNSLIKSYQELGEQNFRLRQKLSFCACTGDSGYVQNGTGHGKRKRDGGSSTLSLDYLPISDKHRFVTDSRDVSLDSRGGSNVATSGGNADDSSSRGAGGGISIAAGGIGGVAGGSGGNAGGVCDTDSSATMSRMSSVSSGSSTTDYSSDLAPVLDPPAPISDDVAVVAKGKMLRCGFEILEQIGRGAFGLVYSAKNLHVKPGDNYEEVAIKFIDCDDVPSWTTDPNNPRTRCPLEASALRRLAYVPSVVGLYGYGELCINQTSSLSFMIMEKPAGCQSFYEYLRRHGPLSEATAMFFLKQMVLIALDIHRSGLVHGDLKPSNLLICAQDRLKVIDFGLVEDVVDDKCIQLAAGGTRRWNQPPERYHGETDLVKATVWSIGVMFYYMIFGTVPFSSPKKACRRPLIMLRPVSKATKNILQSLLDENPRSRVNIHDMEQLIIKHGGEDTT